MTSILGHCKWKIIPELTRHLLGCRCANLSDGDDIDFENASFGLRNLAVDDENRAILKYSLDGKPEYENSQHSVLHGLSFKLSNQDKENSSAQL